MILYAAELQIDQAQITLDSNDELSGTIEMDEENERVKISFDRQLEQGDCKLSLKFIGDINDRMQGFYRYKYTTPDGQEVRYGASTQFEPINCRRAFPCWDEPNFKATYDITLITPKNLQAISNMPIISENEYPDDHEWKITKFDRTPIMSTYLVAYVVGEYDYVETEDSNGVSIRVYTPVGKKEHGNFALDIASKILPFYAEYFNIKYPIAKADQIAIPNFPSEGMENWGLITYSETALLIDPQYSSIDSHQCVAITVAHELSHQWFGNLVTMDWWTDLWLNEGFASWIEYLAVDKFYPEFDIWSQFVADTYALFLVYDALKSSHPIEVPIGLNEGFASWIEYLAVDKFYPEFDIWTQFVADTYALFLVSDALKSSHPIEVPIEHPAEMDEIFDQISYLKGSSVIRMLHDYIGDDAFRNGLHTYLKEYSYKNTVTENLWSHLSEASDKPVNEVMSSWILQMGYPLVTVIEEQQSNQTRIIKLSQQRFIADGSADDENLQWKIPITIFTKSNPNVVAQQILMDQPEITITLDDISENDWIKLNYHSIGLYRVKYESQTLACLSEPIANKILSPQDRLMIQDDVATLCSAGHQSYVDYLKLLLSYKDEDNFTVWKSIGKKTIIRKTRLILFIFLASILDDLSSLIEYTDYYDQFKKYRLNMVSSIQEKLGWDAEENENSLVTMLRPVILSFMGKSGDQAIIDEANKRFQSHINGDLIDPNIRAAVYIIVSCSGDENTQEELRKLYKAAEMAEEKVRLFCSMGHSIDPNIIENTLQFIFESDEVRTQDSTSALAGCTSSRIGRNIVWKFLQKNWMKLVERFGDNSRFLVSFVERCLSDFADEETANEIKSFFDSVDTPIVKRAVKQVLEKIYMRVKVLQRDSKAIEEYLKEQ
ncbi:unnamed protein product [Rotaria sp. Silwood1]|nr:unnamed protein product [Rotaria sp. Silwood1]